MYVYTYPVRNLKQDLTDDAFANLQLTEKHQQLMRSQAGQSRHSVRLQISYWVINLKFYKL